MTPIFAECLALDQLAALERLESTLAAARTVAAAAGPTSDDRALREPASHEALQRILTAFLAEMRGAAGGEIKQLATKLSEVGGAIGQMQTHIDQSGHQFADQLALAASRLLDAAASLQDSFAKGEATLAAQANKAGRGLVAAADGIGERLNPVLAGFAELERGIAAQNAGMREILTSLESAGRTLDRSAETWLKSAAPVAASVEASRQTTAELTRVADRIAQTQRDMTQMGSAMAALAEKTSAVWDGYRTRFEAVDEDLSAAFDRLHGGTLRLGEQFMTFAGKLDRSLAQGMEALSLGTEELRELVESVVGGVRAKAA